MYAPGEFFHLRCPFRTDNEVGSQRVVETVPRGLSYQVMLSSSGGDISWGDRTGRAFFFYSSLLRFLTMSLDIVLDEAGLRLQYIQGEALARQHSALLLLQMNAFST